MNKLTVTYKTLPFSYFSDFIFNDELNVVRDYVRILFKTNSSFSENHKEYMRGVSPPHIAHVNASRNYVIAELYEAIFKKLSDLIDSFTTIEYKDYYKYIKPQLHDDYTMSNIIYKLKLFNSTQCPKVDNFFMSMVRGQKDTHIKINFLAHDAATAERGVCTKFTNNK